MDKRPFGMCRNVPEDPFNGRDEKSVSRIKAADWPANKKGHADDEPEDFECVLGRGEKGEEEDR